MATQVLSAKDVVDEDENSSDSAVLLMVGIFHVAWSWHVVSLLSTTIRTVSDCLGLPSLLLLVTVCLLLLYK